MLTDRGNQGAIRLFASSGGIEASTEPVMFAFRLRSSHA